MITTQDAPDDIELSSDYIIVKSASGHLMPEQLTVPVEIDDPLTGRRCREQILISKSCPANLLGRDAMGSLGIGVVPGPKGMRAVRIQGKEAFVQEASGSPYYYYSIDPITSGPRSISTALIQEGKKRATGIFDLRTEEELHCTMWFKLTPGPNKTYEKEFFRERTTTLCLPVLLWDKQGNTAAAVQLSSQDQKLFRACSASPHISVTKKKTGSWRYLGEMVAKGERAKNWKETSPGSRIWYEKEQGLFKRNLNWSTVGTKEIHLEGGRV